MILHPTVVIGLGSTGKHVVANAQKYLYEVLGDQQLKLFKFIVLETAVNQQGQTFSGAGSQAKPVDIKVPDIGKAFLTLKQKLGQDFSWCKEGMQIAGPGAGNKRAGGRLMFFHHMETIREIVQTALNEVTAAALDDQTNRQINELLKARAGSAKGQSLPATPVPVVLVVGTLAGGTCSGSCVDLGYLLRRIAPTSHREAIFFLPDNGAAEAFKANSWAALSDLAHFTDHPADYKAVWLSKALERLEYNEGEEPGPVPPYRQVYLVTQRDKQGNAHLPFLGDTGSPLLMMDGLAVAANLLGLHELRQTELVNLNTKVGNIPFFNTFLTHSLRGVTYPKYEISEAAACRVITNHVCHYWLSSEHCYWNGRTEDLQEEEIGKLGRAFWNKECPNIWEGLRGNVELAEKARRIRSGEIADVAAYVRAQITENAADTLFSSIGQNVENRKRKFQQAIEEKLVEVLKQKQSIQYASWFLDGVVGEIDRARKFWSALQTPIGDNDMPQWQARAAAISARVAERPRGLSVNAFGQRFSAIEDELEQAVTRLEMFLMYRTFGEIATWINSQLRVSIGSMRKVLTDVSAFAAQRETSLGQSLNDRSGPLLKISRSSELGFEHEIDKLSHNLPEIQPTELIDYANGGMVGLLAEAAQSEGRGSERVYQELMDRILPSLIQRLGVGAEMDIVTEIEKQNVQQPTIQRAFATQELSLSVRTDMMGGADNVPSLMLTKSTQSSDRLLNVLRAVDMSIPPMRSAELPLLDHMALFYQEGGKFDLDSLLFGADLRRAFDAQRARDDAELRPLRLLTGQKA